MAYPELRQRTEAWYRSGTNFHWQGNDVFYRDLGHGPAMLMVHGFPTASCDWAAIAEELRRHFRLIVPDLLDYGHSANPSGCTWHIHDQADMIEALMGRCDVSAAHLVAHDVGDTVCQELIARHNEARLGFTIESLILMNGGIFPSEHRARRVQKLLLSPAGPLVARLVGRKKFMAALSEVFGAHTKPDAEAGRVLWDISIGVNGKHSLARRIHYMKDRQLHEHRWVGALKEAEVRMLMINGIEDPVSGGHVCEVIAREIPAMEVVRLDGIGHFPPLEAPAECVEQILNFHRMPAGQDIV